METNRAIFLDRDGVINIDAGYTHRIEDFSLIDGAASAIRRANAAGFKVLVVTNQGGIGLGYYDHADAGLSTRICRLLEREAAIITDMLTAPTTRAHLIPASATAPAASLTRNAADTGWPPRHRSDHERDRRQGYRCRSRYSRRGACLSV